ncbi:MAG: putative sugar nucleotidyl transferase [Sphingobacteriales bacterium]
MNIALFDTADRNLLYPFTQTRPIADIRIGIFTIREFWENYFNQKSYTVTEKYLQHKFPAPALNQVLLINSALIPTDEFLIKINSLQIEEAIIQDEIVLAARTDKYDDWSIDTINKKKFSLIKSLSEPVTILKYPWQIFQWNDTAIRLDFSVITKGRASASISLSNKLISPGNIFIEEGAKIEYSTLNGSTGPIYIGKNCEVMEGCMIRGPFTMLDGSVLKMGAKIYGATTLGPCCVAGGEIKNSVLFGYSNKAHDGYLGDSVIGEWCNLGAGTSNSNLKNTAGVVNVWNNAANEYLPVGIKCGLIMGDYSRSAINTSFNTGTITGVCSNIFGDGLLPKYIPDFSWGATNTKRYELEKAFADIHNWKQLKNQSLSNNDKNVLKHIFEQQ